MSHMKPDYLRRALLCLSKQTFLQGLQIIVVDSGAWMKQSRTEEVEKMEKLYEGSLKVPNIEWIFTGEIPGFAKSVCITSWIINRVHEAGLVRGEYFFCYCDDDIIYPQYVEKMYKALEEEKHDVVYCWEHGLIEKKDGSVTTLTERNFTDIKRGEVFDCLMDGLQVMWKTAVMSKMEKPVWNEGLETAMHNDGVFFNKLSHYVDAFYPVKEYLCENRRTVLSANTPSVE